MSNYFDSRSSRGIAGVVRPVFFAAAAAWLSGSGLALNAQIAVPADVSSSLGWKALPAKTGQVGIGEPLFKVRSQPVAWPKALETTEVWLNAAPAPDVNSPEGVFRRLARVQALSLSAADPTVAVKLRTERAELIVIAKTLKEGAQKRDEWERESVGRDMQRLNEALGTWLADSAEDRARLFREELAAAQPIPRAELAARYGGEAKFAPMLAQFRKQFALETALSHAQEDTTTPEPARSDAIKKAEAEIAFFNTFYRFPDGYQKLQGDRDVLALVDPSSSEHGSLTVPDLVTWIGEERATPLVLEAFALAPSRLNLSPDTQTSRLALRLLREGKLQTPDVPWSLVEWPRGVVSRKTAAELAALYDTLKAKFPTLAQSRGGNGYSNDDGIVKFAVALALSDREDEGAALLKSAGLVASGLPYHPEMTTATAAATWDFFARVAGEEITPNAWRVLNNLALKADRGDELIALGKATLAKTVAGSAEAAEWKQELGKAYVAADKPEEGIPLLLAALADKRAIPVTVTEKKANSYGDDDDDKLGIDQLEIDLLALAKVLKKPELLRQLITLLTAEFSQPAAPSWKSRYLFDDYAAAMIKQGEVAKITELLRARIGELAKSKPGAKNPHELVSPETIDAVTRSKIDELNNKLLDVLNRQGRHEEVVALLAESPHWNSRDLAENPNATGLDDGHPLLVAAADSLNAVGRREDAARILKAYINRHPGSDPAYGVYVKTEGPNALPFLDEAIARNRFEERPLIWKASLQLAAGKVDEAEATVKQAIAIDPSDGEQPKGDRMRAYSVLREVALKKGDAQQAKFLEGVVSAIRQSEDADDLVAAGLASRAIDAYKAALDAFSDAYCIQSRLARQLAAENRMPEAMEHYRRAFELMPDSFGRVESHCFGCEQAFAGDEAQSVAEKVFLEMAAKPGAKPQVYYLLGYLRKEQGRWDEATDYYSKAVAADPDYLNAWRKLGDAIDHTERSRAEKDRVALRLLELGDDDSYGSAVVGARDFPRLWERFEARAKLEPAKVETLFPLGDKAPGPKKPPVRRNNHGSIIPGFDIVENERSPAVRLGAHPVMSAINSALASAYRWSLREE